MKLSVNWLKQFVPDFDNDETAEISRKLSSSLAEVDKFYDICKELDNILAGEIKELITHPEFNVKIAVVDVGTESNLEIVCGASNIKIGNIVPVCLVGGTVYDPKDTTKTVTIEEKEMNGKKSEGMLCSEKELGIGDDHTKVFILPDDTPKGTNIAAILKDTVIEIENKALTHRPDCFCHLGIAREIAVQNKFKFKGESLLQVPIKTANKPLTVEVKDEVSCKRYSVVVISDVKIKNSPLWLQSRLIAAGMRPINNIVDISNYIMLEMGQPTHAFDYDKIEDNKLVLRKAKKGESITTLDGVERKLDDGMLVNTDGKGVIGIAGVMGGKNSEISASTNTIILQVENFEMFNIRRTTRILGLRTEASTRFEKGLDPNLVGDAMNKFVEMIIDIAGGEIASDVIDIYPNKEENKEFYTDLIKINNFLGIKAERAELIEILNALGIEIIENLDSEPQINPEGVKIDPIKVRIPTIRRDINIKEDLYEEIIRIYGYENIPFELPARDLKPPVKNQRFELEKKLVSMLTASGSDQVFLYSFAGEELYNKVGLDYDDNLKILNPISHEHTFFQDTLVPAILEKVGLNTQRFEKQDIFVISKVVLKAMDNENGIHIQPKFITGAISSREDNLFLKAKGKIELILKSIGLSNIRYENLAGKVPFKKAKLFHPNKSAIIYSGEEQIGIIGYIYPTAIQNLGITKDTVGYELNFDILSILSKENVSYKKIYNFPEVFRDISFWIDEDILIQDIKSVFEGLELDILSKIEVGEIYRSKDKDGKKSITLNITLQSSERTLNEAEINEAIETITEKLTSKLEIDLR